MEKGRTLGTNKLFVCWLLLKEANIHVNLICFDRNFDYPHIKCRSKSTFVPHKIRKTDKTKEIILWLNHLTDDLRHIDNKNLKKKHYLESV